MRAIIRHEAIGANYERAIRDFDHMMGVPPDDTIKPLPRVVRILGVEGGRIVGREVRGNVDYGGGNSKGSRGVIHIFAVDDGVYWVRHKASWKRAREYFCVARNGVIAEIEESEVNEWLRRLWEPPY